MQQIILNAQIDGTIGFEIADLVKYLERVEDKRSEIGRIYPLPMVLAMIILAKLAGQDKPSQIASWLRERKEELWRLFDFERLRSPCLNTLRTIMDEVVNVTELEKLFSNYLHERYGGQTSQLLAMDGKTLRGTIPKGMTQGVHLLAVYLPEEGITLQQVVVDRKENEISAAEGLLADIPLKGRIVCADAMHTQRKLSLQITAAGGDYIWVVKGNQKTLHADVAQFFKPARRSAGWHIAPLPKTTASHSVKAHGRLEKRTLTLMADSQQFLDWPCVAQVFMLERQVTHLKSEAATSEVVYGITSCTPAALNASQLLTLIRSYWGIENGLHYRRDVTLHEDATRFSQPNMATFMATCNNFVIGLAQKLGFSNLAQARRHFDFLIAKQLFALSPIY